METSGTFHYFKGKDDNQNINKLREVISMYLNTPNLNFLLGSGCSCGKTDNLGIPTMAMLNNNFWKENPKFTVGKNSKEKENLKKLSLEQLIEYLQAKKLVYSIEESSPNKEKIQKAIIKIQQFIVSAIQKGMNEQQILETYKMFYRSLENSTRKTPVNIFTTNYDLYNEKAMDVLGYPYNDGFLGTYRRVFNPMVYNYTLVDNMNLHSSIWERIPNFINLYKIHGSISWYPENNEVLMNNTLSENKNNTSNPILIYPTPMKDRTTLMTPYTDLMRCMQNELLKENATLIIFGYSFMDEHINRIILNALAVPSFHLIIFNDSTKTKSLIELNSQRIHIIYSDPQEQTNCQENAEKDYEPIHYFNQAIQNFLTQRDSEEEDMEKMKQKIKDFFSPPKERKSDE